MKEYFIVYDLAVGEERMRGSGDTGITNLQRPAPGMAVVELPQAAWNAPLADAGEALRVSLWERAKARRDRAIDGGATTPIGVVDSDDLSRSNITGAVVAAMVAQAAGAPYSVDWTLADNTVATGLDAAGTIAMGLAVMQHVDACHVRARELRDEIEAAEDVPALLKIDIEAGWPS